MDKTDIFVRSAKGEEEIQKRTYQLQLKHRSILIMIDGKTNEATLLAKISSLGNVPAVLQDLEKSGFIERKTAAPSPSVPSAEVLNVSLKQFMIDQMYELLGPEGDAVVVRIERCRNNKELNELLGACRDTMISFGKPKKAEIFWQEAMGKLSS